MQSGIIFIISIFNDIDFHKFDSGEFMTMFSLSKFLTRIDKRLYDVIEVNMQITHLYDETFILNIENYFVSFNIIFDKLC